MMNRIDAKTKAKALLRGRTIQEMLIFLAILFCCIAAPNIIYRVLFSHAQIELSDLYSFFLAGPSKLLQSIVERALLYVAEGVYKIIATLISLFFSAGMIRCALRLSRGDQSVYAVDILHAFDKLGKFFLISLCKGLFLTLWGVPGIVVCIIGGFALGFGFVTDSIGTLILGIFLVVAGLGWVIFITVNKGIQYTFAFHVSEDHPDMGALDCLRESGQLTNGHKMELFITDLSFLGWDLLSLTFFAQIFTLPYRYLTYAIIYEQLCEATGFLPEAENNKQWITEAAVKRSPALEIISGEHAGSEVSLADGAEVRIGRDPKQANIVVSPASEKISALHCGVRYDSISDCYIVTDYSTNGTYAGSTRLPAGGTRIKRGTVIKLASGEFLFRLS